MKKIIIIITVIVVNFITKIDVYAFDKVIVDDKDTTIITYSGTNTNIFNNRQEYMGGIKQVSGINNGLRFKFSGTALSVYFTRSNVNGQIELYLDGEYYDTYNLNSNNLIYRQKVIDISGLEALEHNVFIRNVGNTVSGNTGNYQIDYIEYIPINNTSKIDTHTINIINMTLLSICTIIILIRGLKI